MKTSTKLFSIFTLLAIFSLTFATPAMAFDGRSGNIVTIKTDEVVNDDVYVTAETFTLDGTVNGDLIVMGSNITINGTVNGDLMAMGQSVVINGTVAGDARIAGAALQLGKTANVEEDLLAGGGSLETVEGSKIGGELVFGAGQSLLAGDLAGNMLAGAGALELRGHFGANVTTEVGDANASSGPAPTVFMPNLNISIPAVKPGFTISKDATIKGNLIYTQSKEMQIPANVVAGKVTRHTPVVDPKHVYVAPTPAQVALTWTFNLVRSMVTLILVGLLLGWLAPKFVATLSEKIQAAPAASLGWGLVAYAAFFFSILLIIAVSAIGAVFFGVLTLRGVSGSIIWLGLVSLFAMIVGFVLVTSFLTKIVVAWLGGRMLFQSMSSNLAESKIWPLILGVAIVALLSAIPFAGWLFGLVVMFFGLGALWIWGRELWQARKIA